MAASWVAPEGESGERQVLFCALALAPGLPAAPRRNFDDDKVPSGNHTHAKMRPIKRHFCKTTL